MTLTDSSSSTAYRAHARRIRARLAHHPRAMHRALQALNAQQGSTECGFARASRVQPDPTPFVPDARERFLQMVLDHLDGPLLRYSLRMRLVRQAERLGIGRFEANLIIATAQHRQQRIVPAAEAPTAARRWPVVATALLLQVAILAAGWSLLS